MKINQILIFLLLGLTLNAGQNPSLIGNSVVYHINGETWEDINSDIKQSILDNGTVISYTSHIQNMLDRTSKAIGVKHNVYKNAQNHLFCKAQISHVMLKKNPHIVPACPYSIAVYELKDKKNTVYVSYRKHPSSEAEYKDVLKLQDKIIREALGL